MTATKSLALLVGTVALLASKQPEPGSTRPIDFLRNRVGLDDRQLQAVEDGEAVAIVLDTSLDREVAVFGVVWVAAPIERYLSLYEDIEEFEASASLQIRKVSQPPELVDFADMTFPEEDLEDLRDCKVGDCEIKLGQESLEHLRLDVDWSSGDAIDELNAFLRERAFGYAVEYRNGGNQALAVYRDKERPTFVTKEFQGLLENTPLLPLYLPALHRYLLEYPNVELPGAEDFFYWAKNDFGLKPIVRLSHVTIYRPPDRDGQAVIASKQLYSSHYFHTALELRFLIEDAERPGGFYFMNLNRSRSDGLEGFKGLFTRGKVKSGARDGIQKVLEHTKRTLEEKDQED